MPSLHAHGSRLKSPLRQNQGAEPLVEVWEVIEMRLSNNEEMVQKREQRRSHRDRQKRLGIQDPTKIISEETQQNMVEELD